MDHFQVLTATEQVADHLRSEIGRRRWAGHLPGSNVLAKELGIGKGTIEAALVMLEEEGLLVPQGKGRRRRIDFARAEGLESLTIQLLVYEESDRQLAFILDLVHKLNVLGHTATFATRTLMDLKMDLNKVARFVGEADSDVWLIHSASGEILQWFADQPEPAYALFGRLPSVDIAGVGILKSPALAQAVQRLVELEHERIVMLTRPERRKPSPGMFERRFLGALAEHGIRTGDYNLPDWENNPADFRRCLDSLFAHSPPTALILSEPQLFFTALQHLSTRGIQVPRDVSMICGDSDPVFSWSEAAVAHLHWDTRLLTRNVLRWVRQVARGKDIRRHSVIEANFVEGGTIGSVRATTQQ